MSLYNKYRARNWEDIIGQNKARDAFRKSVEKQETHTYLLHGPSGSGKTTLARIAAKVLGCAKQSLLDTDAATYNGIEDMRALTAGLRKRPLFGDVKVVILDECHGLSRPAWNSILKATEEPPPWVWWFLCTTELNKVLPTMKTRAATFGLKPVKVDDLVTLLTHIKEEEGLKTKSDIIKECALEAYGSPRQAISNLEVAMYAKDVDDARELLAGAAQSPKAIDLARVLLRGAKWKQVQPMLKDMREENPESVRHVIRAYMTNVILGAKSPDVAGGAMEVLDAFSEPFNSADGLSPLVMACGRLLLAGRG